MRVAVVVPVLDELALLPGLLPRLEEVARVAELVVVDGGSRDGTREALGAHADARGYRLLRASRGRARQMNDGARATTAPALLFLHADSALLSPAADAISAVARTLEGGSVAGAFRLRIASNDPRLLLAAALINLRSRLIASATGDQAIFVRRDVFERIGGYRDLALCEDLDLMGRLAACGRVALLDEHIETSARRWQRNGVWRTIVTMWAIRAAFHLGVDAAKLTRLYSDAR